MYRPNQTYDKPRAPTSSTNIRFGCLPVAAGGGGGGGLPQLKNNQEIPQKKSKEELVAQLKSVDDRVSGLALRELSGMKKEVVTLAPLLCNTFSVISSLLKEITSVYYKLSPPTLSMVESKRFVVTHQGTRMLFVKANIGYYLYPFLSSVDKTKPLEHLRLTALGVIGTLANSSEPEVIEYLLKTEIVTECLKSIAIGCDLSKTVATFILQKILSNDEGLNHICVAADQFYGVINTLAQLATNVTGKPSPELLKNIIRCYLYLTEDPRGRLALRRYLPNTLRDGTFLACMEMNPIMMTWLWYVLSVVGAN